MTNRRRVTRLTARGGFVLGSIVSIFLFAAASPLHSALRARDQMLLAESTRLDEEKRASKAAVGAVTVSPEIACEKPVKALAKSAQGNIENLIALADRVPSFKSESYRLPFDALRAELLRQHLDALALVKERP